MQKAERKGRTQAEVDQIICWLTGCNAEGLRQQIDRGCDIETFFAGPRQCTRTRADQGHRLRRAWWRTLPTR